MVDKKVALVRFGSSSQGVSFSSDGGNDREALEEAIRKAYREEIPDDTPFFLQIKDEEWFGEFVDVSPSKTEIANKSILKVVLKKVCGIFL